VAAQTLTDVTRNYDDAAISGLNNGETITINNSSLTINSDVRWGQQAAVLGSITISATLGGVVLIDGREVMWVPFDAATGNVPTLGTANVDNITGSVAGSGEFLGIFTALGTAPVASGAAIPTSGFIKLRRATTPFIDNEVMTLSNGATVTVNSATGGKRGWIHVVGGELLTVTVPRLGKFEAKGDWFELGETTGADDETFQYPVLDNCPAIQVETAADSGVYEWWLNAGNRWGTATQFVPTDGRGKYFGCVNATGVITIARRASNPCGFKPPTGCKVRIPNIIVSSSNTTNYALNTISGTMATRYDFTTSAAGDIDIDRICGAWYPSFTAAFKVRLVNSAILNSCLISNIAGDTTLDSVAFGLNSTLVSTPVTLSNLFSGGTLANVRAVNYDTASNGRLVFSVADCEGVNFVNCQAAAFGSTTAQTRGNAGINCYSFTRANNFEMNNCVAMSGVTTLAQCANVKINNMQYADQIAGTTTTSLPISAFVINSASINIDINGFSNFAGLSNVHPYTSILALSNAYSVTLRNIGTSSAPYNMGSANACGLIFSASVAANLTFRRIYTQNTRTGPFTMVNTVQGVVMDNVWGDGNDTAAAVAALNVTPRGCRWTAPVTGQASVYGRHWEDAFTSTTAGRILIAMNEPLAATADQVEITAGTPAFTSGGQVSMRTLGDQVVWTMPYFCLGYTSLANIAPTLTGTNTGNFSYEYQIDTGSGFGSYKTLNAANLSGETISPTAGFRLKVRITTTTANSGNALTYVRIDGVTNSTDQQIAYPLPKLQFGTVSGIVAGSRIQVYNVTTAAEIANEVVPGTTYSFNYQDGDEFTDGDIVRIRLTYASGTTAYLGQQLGAVASATGWSALASQQLDTVYGAFSIDGASVTKFTADYVSSQVDLNSAVNFSGAELYAWWVANLFTEDGIANFFGGLRAIDEGNIVNDQALVDIKLDNLTTTNVFQNDNIRLFRVDGAYPVVNPTTGGGGIDINWRNQVFPLAVGGSALTPTESAWLSAINDATANLPDDLEVINDGVKSASLLIPHTADLT
jgi:hypothetical protein